MNLYFFESFLVVPDHHTPREGLSPALNKILELPIKCIYVEDRHALTCLYLWVIIRFRVLLIIIFFTNYEIKIFFLSEIIQVYI